MSRWTDWGLRGLGGAESLLERVEAGVGDTLRTTRFLRGRGEFRARPDDVYVASYPRSGTTWVQFILYLLRSDRSVDFDHISQVSPWWERSLALGSRRAADFEPFSSPRVFKTHLPRRWLPRTGRFVYVVRDGLDVAVSYHQFYASHLGYTGNFPSFFDRFLRGRVQYGSWFKHVEGWRRFSKHPDVYWLSYESLREDLAENVHRLAEFLGWSLNPDALRDVKMKAGFDFMKIHEQRFDPITETLLDRGLRTGRFIRQGRSGVGAEAIDEGMRKRFERFQARPFARPDLEHRLPAFLH